MKIYSGLNEIPGNGNPLIIKIIRGYKGCDQIEYENLSELEKENIRSELINYVKRIYNDNMLKSIKQELNKIFNKSNIDSIVIVNFLNEEK